MKALNLFSFATTLGAACLVSAAAANGASAASAGDTQTTKATASDVAAAPNDATKAVDKSKSPGISKSVAEIVQLSKAGLDATVIQTYLEHSNTTTPPTADEIVYMREQGVSQDIITAVIKRGSVLRSAAVQVATQDDRVRDAMLDARQRVMFANAYPPAPVFYGAPYYWGYGYPVGPRHGARIYLGPNRFVIGR